MAEIAPNIDEFNQIAALVFAQLYREFPVVVDIDRGAIARRWVCRKGIGATTCCPRDEASMTCSVAPSVGSWLTNTR